MRFEIDVKKFTYAKNDIKILALLIMLGAIGFAVNTIDSGLDALFIAFFLGIVLGHFMGNEERHCVNRILKIMLPIAIALYGFNIYTPTLSINPEKILITIAISLTIFLSVYISSLKLGNTRDLSILLSCGSGICGLSAIAIISSIMKPKKYEFSSAIIAITVVGLICTVFYPVIAKLLFPEKLYLLAGSTLPQTGLVKISSSVFGNEEVEKALSIKSIRIAMIAVVAFLISFIYSEKRFYVPWFIVAFLTTAFLGSYFGTAEFLRIFSATLFASTLAGIGMTVDLKEIYRVGLKPLIAVSIGAITSFTIFILLWLGGVV
ncbi:MAG: putative sulfate exporter family transporter [Archaeoglobales archaeon]|nr:putative sulfate exporter family transporter [Archaeoglobales archaeon]